MAIYGIPSGKVPKWNQIEVVEFGKVARLSHEIVEDSGIIVLICTPNQHQMVMAMVMRLDDHASITFCKVPI